MPRISVITCSIRPEYLHITKECLDKQTFPKDKWEWILELDEPGADFGLPRAMNRALARCKGEITVHLQDCIEIPDDFLQHVADTYFGEFVTYPLGKKNGDSIEWDWRKNNNREIQPFEWEADLASAPLKAFYDIGGYDEAFCDGWSWDNVEVGYRAKAAGYNFMCDNNTSGVAIDHDKVIEHPFRGKLKNNDWRARNTELLCRIGDYKKEYLPKQI